MKWSQDVCLPGVFKVQKKVGATRAGEQDRE